MSGWIRIHRQINEHWLWDDPRKLKWWIDILLEVNFKKNKVNLGYNLIECKRGQSIKSLKSWADRWGISKDSARHFLHLLEKDQMITLENLKFTTRLTVCNYDKYNDPAHGDQTETKRRPNGDQTEADPNNKEKEGKESKANKEDLVKSNIELYKKWQSESENDNYRFFVDYILKLNHTGEPLKYCLQLKGQITEQSFKRLYEIMKKNGTKMTDKIVKIEEKLLATNGKSAKDLNLTLGNWLQNKFTK